LLTHSRPGARQVLTTAQTGMRIPICMSLRKLAAIIAAVSCLERLAAEPCKVALGCVGSEREAGDKPVAHMAPMIGRCIARIDLCGFNRVDRFKNARNFWPAIDTEQDIAARNDIRHARIRRAGRDGLDNRDAGMDRPVAVGFPVDKCEYSAWPEGQYALLAIDKPLGGNASEADPLLALRLDPGAFDVGQGV
jgi:hypothetical protein